MSDSDSDAMTSPSKRLKTDDYDVKCAAVMSIAKPLASRKLNKRVLKLVKAGSKKKELRRGVKEVVKALRKGQKGIVVFAGNVSPMDVLSHVPMMCEEKDVPYIYVPAKEDLGIASATKRPTSCIMIVPGKECSYKEKYDKCAKELKTLAKELF